MIWRSRVLIRMLRLAALTIVASVLVSCAGSDSAVRDRIAESIAPVRESVDFDIIIPSYLPAGTQKGPALPWLTGSDNDEISLTFYQNDAGKQPNELSAKSPSRIEIREGKAEGPVPTVDPEEEEYLREEFGWTFESVRIEGADVLVRRDEGPNSAGIALFTRIGEVAVSISVGWSGDWSGDGVPPVVELTPEMEEEFFKIFESMLE